MGALAVAALITYKAFPQGIVIRHGLSPLAVFMGSGQIAIVVFFYILAALKTRWPGFGWFYGDPEARYVHRF